MSDTTTSDVQSSIPEIWAKRVFREHKRAGFWGKFVGGPGSPIVQQTELLNAPGDTIHIQTTVPLEGAGVEGDDATLEGNEENLSTSSFKVMPKLYRHGVTVRRRANKKSIIQLREEARFRLAEWGRDKQDSLRWTQLYAEGSFNGETLTANHAYAGTATDTDELTTGDTFSVDFVRKLRVLMLNQQAKPFHMDGVDWFFAVISPEQALDLKNDSDYNTAVHYALPRSDKNPVFTGALAHIDGVVLYEHFSVPTSDTYGSGSNVPGADGLIFGREFAVEGLDENVNWEEDTFDYKARWGVGYEFAVQTRRALELSSLQFHTARTAVLP